MYTVNFQFEQNNTVPLIINNVEAGQSILELALKHNIGLQHQCGGMCVCTTCHLYIEKGMEFIDELSNREEDFIERVVNRRINSRLGCQSLLLEGQGEVTVTVPDHSLIPKHDS